MYRENMEAAVAAYPQQSYYALPDRVCAAAPGHTLRSNRAAALCGTVQSVPPAAAQGAQSIVLGPPTSWRAR
jgi:hypothetical protein